MRRRHLKRRLDVGLLGDHPLVLLEEEGDHQVEELQAVHLLLGDVVGQEVHPHPPKVEAQLFQWPQPQEVEAHLAEVPQEGVAVEAQPQKPRSDLLSQ